MDATFISTNLSESNDWITTDYERNFDLTYWRNEMSKYWVFSIYIAAIYLIVLYAGVAFMKNRKPFELNGLLIAWNIGLGVLSTLAAYHFLPDFLSVLLSENGFYYSVCEWKRHTRVNAFWVLVMVLSKAIELGDTAFIVLRKKKLMFLHYYHHVATIISWWYLYPLYEPGQYFGAVMNACVHSMMYTYYAIRSMKITVTKAIAMVLTVCQLVQMFMGVFVNLYSLWLMYVFGTPADCPHRCWDGASMAGGIYFSFMLLFANFFIKSYLTKRNKKLKKV